jgi:transaldolase
MEPTSVKKIHDFGQSIWLDFIDRKSMNTGEIQKLIDQDGIRGVTSNPTIFEKAIGGSSDYDEDILRLAQMGKNNEDIFYGVAVSDIQRAADLFKPVFGEDVKGADGYVSLEVSPYFAHDTEATINQARALWKAVDRENVMIKIPGTAAGLPAIRQCIKDGININVTLLFSLDRYEAVTNAYLSGLEDRVALGQPINQIASVASFFLSRIDVLLDPILAQKGLNDLAGEVAIASAKKAYEIYKRVFSSDRFKKLADQGATPQRPLWASTSSKNPAFPDTKYVEALIGPKTVNTLPLETIEAYRDHGQPASRLEDDLEKASDVLKQLQTADINLDELTQKLEAEGLEKFVTSYDKLLAAIEQQRHEVVPGQ